MKSNCPNCGAPITGSVCEYCGTRLVDENIEKQMIEIKNKINYAILESQITDQQELLLSIAFSYLNRKRW